MAHVADTWFRTIDGRKVATARNGRGKRWQAAYRDPTGRERARAFGTKGEAERFLATITVDQLRGAYVDPDRASMRYGEWAARWRGGLSLKAKTLAGYDSLLRSRVLPRWGAVPL